MSKSNSITTSNLLNQLNRFTVGYEPLFRKFEENVSGLHPNYPPYNMYVEDDDRSVIEIAVAGFKKEEVTVTQHENQLIVEGKHLQDDVEKSIEYTHKGISTRAFRLTWTLAQHVEVKNADIYDGILSLLLVREVPEDQKPKIIKIGT